jgi:hypothetical protein
MIILDIHTDVMLQKGLIIALQFILICGELKVHDHYNLFSFMILFVCEADIRGELGRLYFDL